MDTDLASQRMLLAAMKCKDCVYMYVQGSSRNIVLLAPFIV